MNPKKKTIHLAKGLDVPLSITTQKIALMGGNGSGKSYTATKIEEEILQADGWVIILDPVGIHYGLRLDADGVTPSGLDIPVFGGLHGDIILTPESGALIADLLCDRRLSAVLDVSQFTDSELNRFATDFGNQFWARMKANRQAVLLVFEECQEFIPQNPMKGEERKLHIYTRIAKLGRNYGIGVMLISQRPQDVNKKVFNLTQLMFAFQMTGTHERKSMEEWISYVGLEEKFSDILPTLEVGQPFVASPRWLKVADRFAIEPKRTYDASATPDFDEQAETVHLGPIDLSSLESKMKSLVEEAKANDPAELKRQIAKLKKELAAAQAAKPETIQKVEVPVITDRQTEMIRSALGSLLTKADQVISLGENMRQFAVNMDDVLSYVVETVKRVHSEQAVAVRQQGATPVRSVRVVTPQAPARSRPGGENSNGRAEGITNPQQRILDSIAWLESVGLYNPKRTVIAFLAGQSPKSSGFTNNLGALRSAGLITYPSSDSLAFTDAGRAAANPQQAIATTEELQAAVLSRLPRPQARILEILIAAYPDPVNREQLAEQAGQSPRSSGYTNNLGSLRSLGVIDYPSSTEAVALPVLFLE